MKNNNLKYHYTNIEALVNILKSKRLRLTHCRDLKDTSEGKYILDKLKKDLQEYDQIYEAMTSNFFVGCFCEYGDFQSLWNNYGKVNIGFDYKEMNNDIKFVSDESGKYHDTSGIQFGICNYTSSEDETYKNVLEFVKKKLGDIDFSSIPSQQYAYVSCNLCFFLKPIEYREEHEYRIVSHLWSRKPFISETGKKFVEFQFSADKVKKIMIGSSPEKEDYRKQIELILRESNEYKHVEVLESRLEYSNS